MALQKAKAKLAEEKLTIKAKDTEFENIKKEVLEKAKEVVAKRNHHYRECKQVSKGPPILRKYTARATIKRLEKEKIEEAERMKKEPCSA